MKRTASAVWLGNLKQGTGSLSTAAERSTTRRMGSARRFENGAGTNPEELIAAAHAGCFTMATSAALGRNGFTPDKLSTEASVSFDQVQGNWTITAVHLKMSAKVPGITKEKFAEIAADAKANCPVSRVLKRTSRSTRNCSRPCRSTAV
jgi:osmotically inducible protein OsmC